MAKQWDTIEPPLAEWIARQRMFFVGSAPLATDGHVNVSPKGPMGTFRIGGPNEVAYLDVVGSGAETIAHVRENGRIVVMFCAFEGPPRIVRLHGTAEIVLPSDERFAELAARLSFVEDAPVQARRAIVRVDVTRVSDSCGYGVPLMAYEGERPHQRLSTEKRLRSGGPDAVERYKAERNGRSIDGLPALDVATPAR
jgi:predicted pyridoxine 5'-phosphate oxidase superfamily flavin-nucleotide-binding protein